MFRNNYDNDSVTFSPQGRIFQVEYAAEAVKQGSVVVGLTSKTHAVLVAIKGGAWVFQRNAEELSSYQKKLFAIDEHVGLAIAGLTSDARVLSNFMKQQCLSQRLTYDRAMPLETLVSLIGDKAQLNTQHYGKRPYGVGLLVAGVDETGPHLFEFQPSGLTQEMLACAIGARSQMARTYLEKNLDRFAACGRDELIRHGLRALKETLVQDRELTVDNTSVGVVGLREPGKRPLEAPFKVHDGADVKDWINSVADEAKVVAGGGGRGEGRGKGEGEGGGEGEGEGMQVDE
ncbi:nucleophile aminohydrolase [Biscogniauxia marginata]|nr:nucleophile aminohydrolase [Biscogniauxia marginata]